MRAGRFIDRLCCFFGDFEDRDEPVLFKPDLRHIRLYERLPLPGCPMLEHVGQRTPELVYRLLARLARRFVKGTLEIVAAVLELLESDLEVAEALAAEVGVEAAGLEGVEVAVDRSLSLLHLLNDGGMLGQMRLVACRTQSPLSSYSLADEIGVGVEVQ